MRYEARVSLKLGPVVAMFGALAPSVVMECPTMESAQAEADKLNGQYAEQQRRALVLRRPVHQGRRAVRYFPDEAE